MSIYLIAVLVPLTVAAGFLGVAYCVMRATAGWDRELQARLDYYRQMQEEGQR